MHSVPPDATTGSTTRRHRFDCRLSNTERGPALASTTGLRSPFAPRARARASHGRHGEPGHHWALVLAGGSGTRLASLTTAPDGITVPKQYCSLRGGHSLLGDAMARADALVGKDRVVTVVAAEHEPFWRSELGDRDPRNVVVQTRNRGTAAGVLLPLLRIARRDPQAMVTLIPSDHFVAEESILADTLARARSSAARTGCVVLLGAAPDQPETDYGWILPGPRRREIRSVQRFVEKPARPEAESLMHAGGLWNTFLLAGSTDHLLQLYELRQRGLLHAMAEAASATDARLVRWLYEHLPEADFCRDVLTGMEARLGLVRTPACGWTDLGTPARVARCAAELTRRAGDDGRLGSLGTAALRA